MSVVDLVIEEREASVGNFMVGRLIPFRKKRMVGPFVFIDHMGPIRVADHSNLDVDPHPHIGLSTLTYLFEGEMLHRDSIGSNIKIREGEVNWMTAGRGVVHSERMPEDIRIKQPQAILHGLQIWIALPKELQEMTPSFTHIGAEELPVWEDDSVHYKLIAGEALGKKSPVPVHSPLYFIEIKAQEKKRVSLGHGLIGESALYILKGKVYADGFVYDEKHVLIANNSRLCDFEIDKNTIVYIFGGEAFDEERYLLWNFVSDDIERLEKAKNDWIKQNHEVFPLIPGDDQAYVPFPEGINSLKNKK